MLQENLRDLFKTLEQDPTLRKLMDLFKTLEENLETEGPQEKGAHNIQSSDQEDEIFFIGGNCSQCGAPLNQKVPISNTIIVDTDEGTYRQATLSCPYCGTGAYEVRQSEQPSNVVIKDGEKSPQIEPQIEKEIQENPLRKSIVNIHCEVSPLLQIDDGTKVLLFTDQYGRKMPMVLIANQEGKIVRFTVPLTSLEKRFDIYPIPNRGDEVSSLKGVVFGARLPDEDGPWSVKDKYFGTVSIDFLGSMMEEGGTWQKRVIQELPQRLTDDKHPWIFADLGENPIVVIATKRT